MKVKINENLRIKIESPFNGDSFKERVGSRYVVRSMGYIETILIRNNTVFATIKVDPEDSRNEDDSGHVPEYFNLPRGMEMNQMTRDEVFIKTDIPVANALPVTYKGVRVLVTVEDGNAVFASTAQAQEYLSNINPNVIRRVRKLAGYTADIFGENTEKLWKSFGVGREQLKALSQMLYNEEEHKGKTLVYDEGRWNSDTAKLGGDEVLLKRSGIEVGLNNEENKTVDCHRPSRFTSAK